MITDNQSLVSAKSRFGSPIQTYDDGFGPLWIHRDSMGVTGIVRAQTWSDAYSIFEDEFFPECDLTLEQIKKEYGFHRENVKWIKRKGYAGEIEATLDHYPLDEKGFEFSRWETRETPDPEAWPDNELFQESYDFRPNGKNASDKIGLGIYAKDLNGESLDLLTPTLLAQLEITLAIQNND